MSSEIKTNPSLQEQCSMFRRLLLNKSFFFNEDDDTDSDSDSDSDSDNEQPTSATKNVSLKKSSDEEVTPEEENEKFNFLNVNWGNMTRENENIMYILYLGGMTPSTTKDNIVYNCLYNQIKSYNDYLQRQGERLIGVYIQFIGPNVCPIRFNQEKIITTIRKIDSNIVLIPEYIKINLPIVESTQYKIEQLYLLKQYIDRNIKLNIRNNTNASQKLNIKQKYETENAIIVEGITRNTEKVLYFNKPTIPDVDCSFLNVIEKLFDFFINQTANSKGLIINGFWFDTTSMLQADNDPEYFVSNIAQFTGNGLFSFIPYIYELISKLKKKYNEKFAIINQYNDTFSRMKINIPCKDITPIVLDAVSNITTNGSKFSLYNNESGATKSGGKKKKKKRKTRKKKRK